MMPESGEELKLVGRLEVFNDYENAEYLGNKKVVKVANQVANHLRALFKKPPNPLKRLVGAQGLEP